ncbi:MAG TPA: response regulator transcription factor [Chitinophagaceae bacterium]|nr:response regulator transcription factor [Chitinophagaceae bacterium]
MKKITLLIADDHQLVRETLAAVFDTDDRFDVIAVCKNGQEAVNLSQALKPDIALLDINMPDMDGYQAAKGIRSFAPGTKIVCVSMHTDPLIVQRMMQAGASGYVTKKSSHTTLLKAVLDVYAGHKFLCSEVNDPWADRGQTGLDCLTKRELTIVAYVKEGLSSKAIGDELSLSKKTVDVHRYNILRKLKLPNVASLVNYVNVHGFAYM